MAEETNFKPGLESLRGLAAFGVAWTHSNMVFAALPSPVSYPVLTEIRNWLFLILPAGASVTLFFALSGYVLGLALVRDNSYLKFVTRRLFRIFPALWVAVTITYLTQLFFANGLPKEQFSDWFQNVFLLGPTLANLFDNLILIKTDIDPVIWSLAPEVVWSLALPAAAYIHFKSNKLGRLTLLALVFVVGHYDYQLRPSVQFAATFYAGFFVPREILAPLLTRPIFAVAAALSGWALLCIGNHYGVAYTSNMREICMVGAVLLISGVVGSPKSMNVLNIAPLRFLGRVSYSFYLLHLPTLFLLSVAAITFPEIRPESLLSAMIFATASIAIAIFLSGLSHRFIELPGIEFGKRIAAAMSGRRVAQHSN